MTQRVDKIPKDIQHRHSSYDFHELCRNHAKNLSVFTSVNEKKCNVTWPFLSGVSRIFGISHVYAKEPKNVSVVKNSEKIDESVPSSDSSSKVLEGVARLYIAKETGWDRVRSMFGKDHRGKSSEELSLISVTLAQVFVITFFSKYVPVVKFARKEFIREHQATVFRTRLEAIRRMNDVMFMKAAAEGGWFAAKVTLFSASFLLISQTIASYRNKTSIFEYIAASVITGGLARLNMGVKAILSGSIVGGTIGSAIGLVAFSLLSAYDITQQDRHLKNIVSKLEVERSIIGDSAFHQKVKEAHQEHQQLRNLSAS